MQNKKDTSDKLDQLLKISANDTPVMSIDDVQQLLKNAPAPVKGKNSRMWIVWTLLFLSVSTLTYVVFNQTPENKSNNNLNKSKVQTEDAPIQSPEKSVSTIITEETESADEAASIDKPESAKLASELKAPSVSAKKTVADAPPIIRAYTYYYSRNDKKIAVTVIDGDVIHLTEDDMEIPKSSYGEFEEIIQKSIKKSFEENSVKVADEKGYSERYIKWKQKLTEQLVNDQLIENDSGFEFSFENNNLYINGIEQPEIIYEKYKSNYEKSTGKKIHAGTSLTIRKQ
ncbi:MAG: hypothetical protein BWY67_01022 [Bacteroidetes bacterium ADurb.Bin397]|jgi:hypothetical protein|nr:MAG: hypothetical protein BWY67_01022 [Bacteroidetes bacterium ADurb.Bin397]